MKNLLSLIQDEKASIKLEVSGEDLLEFSNDLINRAKSELSTEIAESRKERYWLCPGSQDMRKGIDALSGTVRSDMGRNPLSGEVFIFMNRSRTTIK
jgi:hypothetical protein